MKTITKAALARKLGVSKARVSAYCQKGMPVLESGLLDEVSTLEWIQKNIAPKVDPGSTAGAKLLNIRASSEAVKMQLRLLELQKRRGELISAREAELAWSGMITAARNELLSLPDNAGMKFGEEVGAWLRVEINRALTNLGQY